MVGKLAARQAIIDLAKSLVGSHYLWGSTGATPYVACGTSYRPLVTDPTTHKTTLGELQQVEVSRVAQTLASQRVCGFSLVPRLADFNRFDLFPGVHIRMRGSAGGVQWSRR